MSNERSGPGPLPFACALHTARKAAGLTTGQLAERLGTSTSTLCNAEAGRQVLTEEHTRLAAEELGADIEALLLARRQSKEVFRLVGRWMSDDHRRVGERLERAWAGLDAATLAAIEAALG